MNHNGTTSFNSTSHHDGVYPVVGINSSAVLDVQPTLPDWRSALAPYTHSLSWLDADGCNHSLTLRANTLEQLLSDLKLIKEGIRTAKAVARQQQQGATETATETQPYVQRCTIHDVDMLRRWSKRTNGHYFAHKLANGDFCYGRSKR